MTIRPDFEKWNQSADEIWRLSLEAEHKRSRERFQAIHMVGTKRYNSSEWAEMINRQPQTVLEWVHRYNETGPQSLHYQHSGGRQAKLDESEKKDS